MWLLFVFKPVSFYYLSIIKSAHLWEVILILQLMNAPIQFLLALGVWGCWTVASVSRLKQEAIHAPALVLVSCKG